MHPEALVQLARTLDLDQPRYQADEVPILGHWTAFLDWPASAASGMDGPPDGHHYPPMPDRRRMFAVGTVTAHQLLLVGIDAIRRTSVQSVTPKRGSTGEMIFVVFRHEYSSRIDCAGTNYNTSCIEVGAAGRPGRWCANRLNRSEPPTRHGALR